MNGVDATDLGWMLPGVDDEMLEAALHFLEDDGTVSGSLCTDAAAVSVNKSAPRGLHVQLHEVPVVEPNTPVGNKQRKRTKEQIEELCKQVDELERICKRLRSRKDVEDTVSDVQEAVVTRQLLQRYRVEVENERLRLCFHENTALMQTYNEMIIRGEVRGARTLRTSRSIISRLPSSQVLDGVSEVSDVLASVTSALVPMYNQTKWVLSNPDLDTVAAVSDGCKVMTKTFPGVDGPAVHLLDSRIVPFDLETTTRAVLENLTNQLGSVRDLHDSPAEVFQTRENLMVQLPAFDGIVQNIMALRRFNESDHEVIVRSSVFTYLDNHERIVLPGLAVRHFVWTIVKKPCPSRPEFSSASQIQTLSVAIPISSPGFHASAEAIAKFLSDLSQQFHAFSQEGLDDRLLRG